MIDNNTKPIESDQRETGEVTLPSRFVLRFGYACGHVQNDLCSAMYFSYLLVYLELTGLSPVEAGVVMIVGQLVDGLTTPFVGSWSDQFTCCEQWAGRRKSWYIGGFILVSATFWALFTPCPDQVSPVAFYTIANSLFQIGWATVQVSHMAVVPELTPLLSERTVLNSIRFAVTVGTSIAVYVMVWIFSAVGDDRSNSENEGINKNTEKEDDENNEMLLPELQIISYIVLLSGALFGLVFVLLVHESTGIEQTSAEHEEEEEEEDIVNLNNVDGHTPVADKNLCEWFQTPGFVGVTANYTVTRICVNSLQVYIPFYALNNMDDSPTTVAIVPLIAFVGMCLSSVLAPRVSALLTDAVWVYAAGGMLTLLGAVTLLFLAEVSEYWIYVAVALLGIGSAQLMITSQTQVCELVGVESNGGVVFGISSLCDKISTGLVIFFVQRSAQNTISDTGLADLYRLTLGCVPIGCAVLGLLAQVTVSKKIRDR